ncbi:MAG: cytochrome P450 [Hyphomicrobiaceae bacterium]
MSDAPVYSIDVKQFGSDPYPDLARMRRETAIAHVPELGATLITRRDDIFVCEKNVAVFSSEQPGGLMTTLMGQNMMRKDGDAHMAERQMFFPAVSPRAVREVWKTQLETHTRRILDAMHPAGTADLVAQFALPVSGEALKLITGLTNITYQQMDAWSQAMIDGIANYIGNPAVEQRCREATSHIDAAIDDMLLVVRNTPDRSLLSTMLLGGMDLDAVRANIKLTISGGQNEPRDAIAGCIWALLTHPDQLDMIGTGEASWQQAFEEYCRWISPIGMSPRRVAQPYRYGEVTFEPDDRVFLMFGSANRDEAHFEHAERFDIRRDTQKSVAFGAGPHYCAGAAASRTLVADVALPMIFATLKNLRLDDVDSVRIVGWAFRGAVDLPASWDV